MQKGPGWGEREREKEGEKKKKKKKKKHNSSTASIVALQLLYALFSALDTAAFVSPTPGLSFNINSHRRRSKGDIVVVVPQQAVGA
jgi:hypothetical protein